jgi:hypothetical protein
VPPQRLVLHDRGRQHGPEAGLPEPRRELRAERQHDGGSVSPGAEDRVRLPDRERGRVPRQAQAPDRLHLRLGGRLRPLRDGREVRQQRPDPGYHRSVAECWRGLRCRRGRARPELRAGVGGHHGSEPDFARRRSLRRRRGRAQAREGLPLRRRPDDQRLAGRPVPPIPPAQQRARHGQKHGREGQGRQDEDGDARVRGTSRLAVRVLGENGAHHNAPPGPTIHRYAGRSGGHPLPGPVTAKPCVLAIPPQCHSPSKRRPAVRV